MTQCSKMESENRRGASSATKKKVSVFCWLKKNTKLALNYADYGFILESDCVMM